MKLHIKIHEKENRSETRINTINTARMYIHVPSGRYMYYHHIYKRLFV